MKINKIIALILAVAAITLSLAACGKSGSETNSTTTDSDSVASTTQTIKLGVVGSDKEIWLPAQEKLKEEGIILEFVEFSDYTTPNNALANGEIDLNAFQHQVYLDSEVSANGYKIEAIGYTLLAPLNLYSSKIKSVDELKDGDIVAVPNDATNEGRALKVLEHAGIITLKADAPFSPTIQDIETYNIAVTIEELAANTITSVLPDVTAAIVNGNYAVDFGLSNDDAIYKDNSTGA
jgi:D-methionine transport system substrate-binding protein